MNLVRELAAANSTLANAVADIVDLRIQMDIYLHERPDRRPPGGRGRGRCTQIWEIGYGASVHRTTRLYNNLNYCYTHVHDITDDHTSETCRWPCVGYKTEVVKTNIIWGGTRRKHLVDLEWRAGGIGINLHKINHISSSIDEPVDDCIFNK